MPESTDPSADAIEVVGLLAEPTRRNLYRYVAGALHPVSREEAADRVGVPVHTAKFHLDRLVDAGLLNTEFHKLTGRTGPGSGRPTKHYRRSQNETSIALPPRQYDLLSDLLADAVVVSSRTGEAATTVAGRLAYQHGRAWGRHASNAGGTPAARLGEALQACGFEPSTAGDLTILRNCPFRRTATRHPELVCGMNLDLIAGVLAGLGLADDVQVRLNPQPERCCVTAVVTAAAAANPGREEDQHHPGFDG